MGENKYQLNYKKCIEEYHSNYKQVIKNVTCHGTVIYINIMYINHYEEELSFLLNNRHVNFIFRYPSYINNFIKNKRNIARLPTNYYL